MKYVSNTTLNKIVSECKNYLNKHSKDTIQSPFNLYFSENPTIGNYEVFVKFKDKFTKSRDGDGYVYRQGSTERIGGQPYSTICNFRAEEDIVNVIAYYYFNPQDKCFIAPIVHIKNPLYANYTINKSQLINVICKPYDENTKNKALEYAGLGVFRGDNWTECYPEGGFAALRLSNKNFWNDTGNYGYTETDINSFSVPLNGYRFYGCSEAQPATSTPTRYNDITIKRMSNTEVTKIISFLLINRNDILDGQGNKTHHVDIIYFPSKN